MTTLSKSLTFFLTIAKFQATMTRRFDAKLGGLGLSEFLILLELSNADNETMRRIDLAEKIGLTASGVTRLLLPMEKIGLVKTESTESDARVRSVKMASGGRRKLEEALERAEIFCEECIPTNKLAKVESATKTIQELV